MRLNKGGLHMKTLEAIALGTVLTLNGCMDYTLSPEETVVDPTVDTGYVDSGQTEDSGHYVTQNACDASEWDIPTEGTERENCVAIEHYVLRFDSEEQRYSTQLYFGNCPDLARGILGYCHDIIQYSVAEIEQTEYNLPGSYGWSNRDADCSDDGENVNYYQYSVGVILPEYQDVSVTRALYFFTSEESATGTTDLREIIAPSFYETIDCPADATTATDCTVRMDHYL